jgi:hypothetical protein
VRHESGDYRPQRYVPQPYEQLAAVFRCGGLDKEARLVLLEKHRRDRTTIPWRQWYRKLWSYAQDCLVGYGYVPWRAFLWLLLLLLSSAVLVVSTTSCDFVDGLGYSAGLVVPGLGSPDSSCKVTGSWRLLGLFLAILSITLGATVVAAVARVARR